MALLINDDCTGCDACVDVCPNKAIRSADPIYIINPDLCTECVGSGQDPQCVDVCPADCILPDPAWRETPDQLQAKYDRIHA